MKYKEKSPCRKKTINAKRSKGDEWNVLIKNQRKLHPCFLGLKIVIFFLKYGQIFIARIKTNLPVEITANYT